MGASTSSSSRYTSLLAKRVARDLKRFGWKLQAAMADHGSEFRNDRFCTTIETLDAELRFARRPQTNGCVVRLQGTILQECRKPAFARYLIPAYLALTEDLERSLGYYDFDRIHTGPWTRGRTPAQVIGADKMWSVDEPVACTRNQDRLAPRRTSKNTLGGSVPTLPLLSYVFVAFGIGLLCLGAMWVLWSRNSQEGGSAFLLFYVPLTVLVLAGLLSSLVHAFSDTIGAWLPAVEYLEALPATYAVFLTLPLATRRLLRPGDGRGDRWIIILVVAAFVGQHVTEYWAAPFWDARGDLFENWLFIGLAGYALALAMGALVYQGQSFFSTPARYFATLLVLGMPMVVHDILTVDGAGLRLYPLWYGALGVAMVMALYRRPRPLGPVPPEAWQLTDREMEVLSLMQAGLSNPAIAERLSISLNTVKTHMANIYDKAGVRGRVAVVSALSASDAQRDHPIG